MNNNLEGKGIKPNGIKSLIRTNKELIKQLQS